MFVATAASIEKKDKEWLAAVGLMAVYWADLEIMMDTYIGVMLTHPASTLGGDKSIDTTKVLDISFNKRIRLWKDTVAELPLTDAMKSDSLGLAERARNARNHRDLLLHGMTRRNEKGMMVASHVPKKADQEVQLVPYPPDKVLKVAGEILDVHAMIIMQMLGVMPVIIEASQKIRGA